MEKEEYLEQVLKLIHEAIDNQDLIKLMIINQEIDEMLKITILDVKRNHIRNIFNLLVSTLFQQELYKETVSNILELLKQELKLLKQIKKMKPNFDEVKNLKELIPYYELVRIAIKIHIELNTFFLHNIKPERTAPEYLHSQIIKELLENSTNINCEIKRT